MNKIICAHKCPTLIFLGFLFVLFLFFCGFFAFSNVYADSDGQVEARKAELKRELNEIEIEIEQKQNVLRVKERERVSIERDVSILEAKIDKALLEIRRRNLVIAGLNDEIGGKQQKVNALEDKLGREKESLSQLIRKINNLDDYSLIEIILKEEELSDFFTKMDSFKMVNRALKDSLKEVSNLKKETQEEKRVLQDKKQEEVELRQVQILQKNKIEEREAEKQGLLSIAKNEEQQYKNIIAAKEKTAAEIRSELFSLRDTRAIPFGEALSLAREAESKTSVRPAFLLGILAEETNIGEFLGSGVWSEDMHPTRDRPVYLSMSDALGFDPDEMPVSKAPYYGWGGAMGPAQFIPSTWVCYGGFINTRTGDCNNSRRSFAWGEFWKGPWEYRSGKDRVRKLTGSNFPSNPWEPRDAFMASALLLSENGADKGTYSAERLAALRYFAGWVNATNPSYAFYGNDVMELAAKYQKQIDILEKGK